MAPSMTTPAATYFQSATSNFRASATMAAFVRQPPLRTTRSLNQAQCGITYFTYLTYRPSGIPSRRSTSANRRSMSSIRLGCFTGADRGSGVASIPSLRRILRSSCRTFSAERQSLGLLAICGLSAEAVLRLSSATIVMVTICYCATYPMRRSAILGGSLPRVRWVPIVAISTLVIIALVCNTVGSPYRPAIGPIAVASTWTLVCGAVIFVLALNPLRNDTEAGTKKS